MPAQITDLGQDSRAWRSKTWNAYGFRGSEDGVPDRPALVANVVSGFRTFGAVKNVDGDGDTPGAMVHADATAWVQMHPDRLSGAGRGEMWR